LYLRAGIIALVGLLVIVIASATLPAFLAVSAPSGRGVLVVEAWIPKASLMDAVRVFQSGDYQHLVLAGGPMRANEISSPAVGSYADAAEVEVKALNVSPDKVIRIPVSPASHRTFATAVAVRRWLATSQPSAKSVDVFTAGVHARKSWILFRYALGDGYRVGVIAGPEHSYDSHLWIFSTRGVRIVCRNVVGYIYFKTAVLLDGHGWNVLTEKSREKQR
jgi:hypothetical protein